MVDEKKKIEDNPVAAGLTVTGIGSAIGGLMLAVDYKNKISGYNQALEILENRIADIESMKAASENKPIIKKFFDAIKVKPDDFDSSLQQGYKKIVEQSIEELPKKMLIKGAIFAGISIIGGCGMYLYFSSKNAETQQDNENIPTNSVATDKTKTEKIHDKTVEMSKK
jgi:hypothetical protein